MLILNVLNKHIDEHKGHKIIISIIFGILLFIIYVLYSSLPSSNERLESSNQPRVIILEATPSATTSTQNTASTSSKSIMKSKIPTPTPLASSVPFQDPCKDYKQSDGLAYLDVTFQYPNTQDTDTIITLKPAGQCPAVLPTGESSQISKTITTGTTSWRSSGFGPGQLRVDVNYKSQGQGFDINFTSGNHSLTVDLKNP